MFAGWTTFDLSGKRLDAGCEGSVDAAKRAVELKVLEYKPEVRYIGRIVTQHGGKVGEAWTLRPNHLGVHTWTQGSTS